MIRCNIFGILMCYRYHTRERLKECIHANTCRKTPTFKHVHTGTHILYNIDIRTINIPTTQNTSNKIEFSGRSYRRVRSIAVIVCLLEACSSAVTVSI